MVEYKPEELRPYAIQTFGELRRVFHGNYQLIRSVVDDAANNWTIETEASFVANFPDDDPQKAHAAFRYLADHFVEMVAEDTKVHIPSDTLRRFGFE